MKKFKITMAKTREEELIEFVKNNIKLKRWDQAKENLLLLSILKEVKPGNREFAKSAKQALEAGRLEMALEFIQSFK